MATRRSRSCDGVSSAPTGKLRFWGHSVKSIRRHRIAAGVFGLSLLCSVSAAATETYWERYLNYPSAENARKVTEMTSSRGSDADDVDGDNEINLLRTQVVAGDRFAFRATLRLIMKSDGGRLEDLMGVLASAIRPKPQFFLEEVLLAKIHPGTLKGILRKTGQQYVDRREAQAYELKMRRAALASIRDKHLQKIRQQCLRMLEKFE